MELLEGGNFLGIVILLTKLQCPGFFGRTNDKMVQKQFNRSAMPFVSYLALLRISVLSTLLQGHKSHVILKGYFYTISGDSVITFIQKRLYCTASWAKKHLK